MFEGPYYIGAFWFDVASTLPAMIYKEENLTINALKFLRFYHFKEIFYPIETVTAFLFRHSKNYYKSAVTDLVDFFGCIILFAHFFACLWIYLGSYDTNHGDL